MDVTTLGHTDSSAADAFVTYLLSPPGRSAFKAGGYELLTPKVFGEAAALPPGCDTNWPAEPSPGPVLLAGWRTAPTAASLVAAVGVWVVLLGPVIALIGHLTPPR